MQDEPPGMDSTRQLRRVQEELAGILYAISHDVRAPLRSIAGFTQALQEHAAADLDDTALRYLQRIQQANQKLATFIDGLLTLSRITHAELRPQDVDLTRLCSEVADAVRARHPQQQVTVTLQENMQVWADAQLLKMAFDQLFDNACKATADCAQPRIDVDCTATQHGQTIAVRDNGIGFDMQYADKLFVPFQRLHAGNFAAGPGVGLAAVQRILLRHDGSVTASSSPAGAVFQLELPRNS